VRSGSISASSRRSNSRNLLVAFQQRAQLLGALGCGRPTAASTSPARRGRCGSRPGRQSAGRRRAGRSASRGCCRGGSRRAGAGLTPDLSQIGRPSPVDKAWALSNLRAFSQAPWPGRLHVQRNALVGQQPVARILAEGLARSSAGRCANGCAAPTVWMRARKRPIHSSTSAVVQLGRAPAAARADTTEGKTAKRGAACARPCTSGPTAGTSAAVSSAAKACSSRICASLQRPGR
jgi:hypothetical protein